MKEIKAFPIRAKQILTTPADFFDATKKEKGVKRALIFITLVTLLNTLISIILLSVPWLGGGQSLYGIAEVLPSAFISLFVGVLLSFVVSGVIHLWLKLFQAKGGYDKTYQMYSYSRLPSALLEFFPIISLVALVYSFVLMVMATERFHDLTRKRAIVAFVLLFVLFAIFQFILTYLFLQYISIGDALSNPA